MISEVHAGNLGKGGNARLMHSILAMFKEGNAGNYL